MLWEQLRTASGRKLNKNEVQQIIIKFILGECRNLQILILEGSVLHFPLTEQRDLRRMTEKMVAPAASLVFESSGPENCNFENLQLF